MALKVKANERLQKIGTYAGYDGGGDMPPVGGY